GQPAAAGRSSAGPAGRSSAGRPAPVPTAHAGERVWLWVRVDREVLRGADAGIPEATAELVGLATDKRRTFSSRYGPVTLAHDRGSASRGSVRAVALAAGAGEGDTLLLGFSTGGDVAVEVHRPSTPPGSDPVVGVEAPGSQPFPTPDPGHPPSPPGQQISSQGAP
ncbi:MAG: hypothetical protein ACRD0J_16735, partial [Acidimicrobiales bacterium]